MIARKDFFMLFEGILTQVALSVAIDFLFLLK